MFTFENFISIGSILGSFSVLLAAINVFSTRKNKKDEEKLKLQKEELINLYLPLEKILSQCDSENYFEYFKENQEKINSIIFENYIYMPAKIKKTFFELNASIKADESSDTFNETYIQFKNKITARYEELKGIFNYPAIPKYMIAKLNHPFIEKLPGFISSIICLIIELSEILIKSCFYIIIFIAIILAIIILRTNNPDVQIFAILALLIILYSIYIVYKTLK